MDIIKKIAEKSTDLFGKKTPVIAFLGDSVTQGCFECYMDGEDLKTVFDKNSAYHNYLAKILGILFPSAPVTMINAGISGDSSAGGYKRLERDVLPFHPDLTVVSFGLNDAWNGLDYIPTYKENLKNIFMSLQNGGSEVIFMTANMMNTKLSPYLAEGTIKQVAKGTMELQNNGVVEAYFSAAKEAAAECGVKVCDVYSKWKQMQDNGVDTTSLLANYINHPVREMNWLFAVSLIDCMFQE